MRVLQIQTKGVQVYFLQRLLNKAAKSSGGHMHQIVEDGIFGSRETEPAVRAFQAHSLSPRLKVDGIVGSHTWAALGQKVEIDHKIHLKGQTSNWSCWQAAATMISEARGRQLSIETSTEHMQYYLSSGLNGDDAATQLANELGWQRLNHSPGLWELIEIMRMTPVYVSGILTATGGAHAVVFGGLFSDGQPDGTVIKVYNPSPAGFGLIHQFFYDCMVSPLSGSPFIPRGFLVPN
jgi:hypothetical protein